MPSYRGYRFPPEIISHAVRSRRGRQGDTWYLDEVFVRMRGRPQYLWRGVDEDGDVIDVLVQARP